MPKLSRRTARINTALSEQFASTDAYIDTIELHVLQAPKGTRSALEAAHGRRIRIVKCRNDRGEWGCRIILHQPSKRALWALDRVQEEARGTVVRLDIAYDLSPIGRSSDWLRAWILKHSILRNQTGIMVVIGDTVYFVAQETRGKRSNRNLVFYNDKPSKLTGELDVPHLEIRYQTAEALKGKGIYRVKDVFDFDPRSTFDQNIKLVDMEGTDRVRQRYIRDHLAAYRESHSKRPQPKSETLAKSLERYHANLKRRLEGLWDRLLLDNAHMFNRHYPRQVIDMERLSSDVLGLPDQLTFRRIDIQQLSSADRMRSELIMAKAKRFQTETDGRQETGIGNIDWHMMYGRSRDSEPTPKKRRRRPVVRQEMNHTRPQEASHSDPLHEQGGVKSAVKRAIIQNPGITLDDLCDLLAKKGITLSRVTVANIRQFFRDDIRFLIKEAPISKAKKRELEHILWGE